MQQKPLLEAGLQRTAPGFVAPPHHDEPGYSPRTAGGSDDPISYRRTRPAAMLKALGLTTVRILYGRMAESGCGFNRSKAEIGTGTDCQITLSIPSIREAPSLLAVLNDRHRKT